ncbi:nucleotide sugar dehydrogenase [Candidatus Foliamicus sp.]
MKITVHGCGYVGLVTGACFAETGVSVVCFDINAGTVEQLAGGGLHINEPGLQDLVRRNQADGRLRFTSDIGEAVEHGDAQFIAVSTPPGGNGAADPTQVFAVAESIAEHMPGYRLVVCKSTIPVGACAGVEERMRARLAVRGAQHDFEVVSNPEFLKAGAAVSDFMHPERIILGTDSERAVEYLSDLYAPFDRNRDRIMVLDRASAELTKCAVSAMLATRIAEDGGVGPHPVGQKVSRPWGSFEGLGQGAGYQVKRLRVLPGQTLSLQRHRQREEHWVVVGGAPVAVRDGEDHPLKIGDHILIPVGAVHRIHNPGKQPAEVVEVQLGDYLGEDDIERLEDIYGRA